MHALQFLYIVRLQNNHVEHQLHRATQYPENPLLCTVVNIPTVVTHPHRLKINDRKKQKQIVWKDKEICQKFGQRWFALDGPQIVQINDDAEHKKAAENPPERRRDGKPVRKMREPVSLPVANHGKQESRNGQRNTYAIRQLAGQNEIESETRQ